MGDTLHYDEQGIRDAMKAFAEVVEVLRAQNTMLGSMADVLRIGWSGKAKESFLATFDDELQPLLYKLQFELLDIDLAAHQALVDMIECDTQLARGPVTQAVSLFSAIV